MSVIAPLFTVISTWTGPNSVLATSPVTVVDADDPDEPDEPAEDPPDEPDDVPDEPEESLTSRTSSCPPTSLRCRSWLRPP